MITTNNERQNDKILAENERHWADVEDEKDEDDKWNCEAANVAEDEAMDERDGF